MSILSRTFVAPACLVILAGGLLLFGNREVHSYPDDTKPPVKWEYSTTTVDIASLAATLAELGPQGWEVFSVDHVASVLDQPGADGKTRLVVEKMQVTAKRPAK